jgi:nucleotide-binding universal stress UspA family protein
VKSSIPEEVTMSKPLLVGVDPHREDNAPLKLAFLFSRISGAPVYAVASYAPARPLGDLGDRRREHAEDALVRAISHLPAHARRLAVEGLSAGRALNEQTEMHDAALLVIGSAHHGPLGRIFMGSTADRMLHGTRCAVALAPVGYKAPPTIENVGIAFVDTPEGRDALAAAAALARRTGATLHIATVVQPINWSASVPPPPDWLGPELERGRVAAEDAARNAVASLAPDVPVAIHAVVDTPVTALARMSAAWDLLVCGSRGYGPVRSVLLGSVSRALAHEAACPLLVVPREAEHALEELFADRPAAAHA